MNKGSAKVSVISSIVKCKQAILQLDILIFSANHNFEEAKDYYFKYSQELEAARKSMPFSFKYLFVGRDDREYDQIITENEFVIRDDLPRLSVRNRENWESEAACQFLFNKRNVLFRHKQHIEEILFFLKSSKELGALEAEINNTDIEVIMQDFSIH